MVEILKNILIAGLTFISPIWGLVVGLAIMVIFDLLTGMWAAYVKGEKIESKKMRMTVGKFIAYFALILISHVMDKVFIIPIFTNSLFTRMVGFFIASVEFKSVCENFSKILGFEIWDKIKEFLAQNKKQ